MAIKVIDTGTSQRNLDFALAKRDGWDACYVKMGGDNVGRYVAPHYRAQVDSARAVSMRVGHYWVPSASKDPIAAADYFVDNLRGWTPHDFAVLDNESLDGAVRYGDGPAAAWINRVKARLGVTGAQVLIYSGLADARGTAWPEVLATGTNFIVAAYSYNPLQIPGIPTIPASRIVGHQYGGGPIGGVVTDTNMFVDSAFNYAGTAALDSTSIKKLGDIMARYIWAPGRSGVLVKGETGGIYYPATPEEAESLSKVYNGLDVDDRTWDVSRQASLNILNAAGGSLSSVTSGIDKAFAAIAKLISDGSVNGVDINVDDLAAKLAPLLAASGIEAKVDAKALAEVFLNASADRLAA